MDHMHHVDYKRYEEQIGEKQHFPALQQTSVNMRYDQESHTQEDKLYNIDVSSHVDYMRYQIDHMHQVDYKRYDEEKQYWVVKSTAPNMEQIGEKPLLPAPQQTFVNMRYDQEPTPRKTNCTRIQILTKTNLIPGVWIW